MTAESAKEVYEHPLSLTEADIDELDYKRPARLGDVVKARTWVGTASTHAFDRHTEIVRDVDGRLLARARTVWCPIDLETGRPMKVDDDVRRRFSVLAAPGSSP